MLTIERLTKQYDTRGGPVVAFEDVSLTVPDGGFVTLIGPSGCGKSTLLHVVAGLERETAGTIELAGRPRTPGDFGYMMQKDLLMPWNTVLDNVAIGLELEGRPKREARARARELLTRYGLGDFCARHPGELSGGMRQRAALIRTLLVDRPVILLDEPFGALDALTRARMQEWLLQVWETEGKTIMFVTHDIEEAIFVSDRVVVLSPRPGRIAEVIDIDLPRPRRRLITADPRFMAIKERLLRRIYGDEQTAGVVDEAVMSS